MGADRKLLDWEKVVSYFEALDTSSDRLHLEQIGKSVDGRPLIAAFISDPATISNLDTYRDIQARLADPRRTFAAAAEELAGRGKAVVMITCSIHATEVASTSTAVQIAFDLLTRDSAKSRAILENTILILVPSLNPDGVDIVTNWYRKTLDTPYEGTSPPELYHRYLGHDNNRDWYIFSQPETRAVVARLHNVWHPHIVYDVHQQGAYSSRMFVPPWLDPIDPNIDPIIAQLCNAIGAGMAADLTSAGKRGVAINAMYDFWTPARHYQAYHGGLRILSESASARLATPITVTAEELSRTALGYNPREPSWNHLEPWAGGEWRVADIVDYQLIAMESCLYQAAVRREDLLRSAYTVLRRAAARPSPYAFVVPMPQQDPGAARVLLKTLAFGAVEIERAAGEFQAGGNAYSAGSYVVRLQQPYGSFAKTLLERQSYPDLRLYPGGPPRRPYDVTAHTLPLLMGVRVDTIEAPFEATLERSDGFAPTPHNGARYSAGDSDAWRGVTAAWRANRPVWRDAEGNFWLGEDPGGGVRINQPRIAVYKSYMPSMDEGWTRWLLEQFGFPYTNVLNADVRGGDLHRTFDVIVIPDQKPAALHLGHKPGAMPPQYTGGLGEKGAAALRSFAENGGTLIFLNEASRYAIGQLRLNVKDGLEGLPTREFYAPGSILNAEVKARDPLALGMPASVSVWYEDGPAFEIAEEDGGGKAVLLYPEAHVLASGWLLGEKHIARRAAVLDVPVGAGRAILFGIRPQYRAQSYQTFKLFFNALIGTTYASAGAHPQR
jgi:hypothetical protein